MKLPLLLFAFLILFTIPAFSQNIRGVVVDEETQPVAAASIYITETKQGTIANAEGAFLFSLPPGTYHLEVKSLSYETANLTITVGEELIEKTIVLKAKDIQLAEVQVSQGEDRAYAIMREAIKKAPYYQQIIKSAQYETYSKGSGKLTGMPALFYMTADKEDKEEMEMYKDRLFLEEALTEVKYEAPDNYERTVKAFSSTMPFERGPESALSVGMISMYYPEWGGGVISPLNPKAFNYYRFRYEGYDEEDGRIVNIIRIIPKLKDSKLIKGIIHIADEEWDIRFIDYTVNNMMGEIRYIMNFNHIQDDVYLVTNYEFKVNFNMMGFRMDAAILSSVQYSDVQLNDLLIMAYQDKSPKPPKKKEKKNLEIKPRERNVEVDSLATGRDSLYWQQIRTIALNEEELGSYQYRDTLKLFQDSLTDKIYNPEFTLGSLIFGGRVGSDSTLMYFGYNGLIGGLTEEYNFVDGWWLGQSFELDFKKRRNTGLVVKPDIYWALSRKELLWKIDWSLDYAPRRLGNLSLSFGSISKDFAGDAGIGRDLNTIFTFNGGRNHARFYGSKYIDFLNKIDIANGLQLSLGGQYEKVELLENHTTWNLYGVKDKWKPNTPDYPNPPLSQDTRAGFSAGLKFTPEYYYRIHEGKKYYAGSRFPTFTLEYRHGFSPSLIDNNSHYNQLEFAVEQTISLGYFSRLGYKLAAGKFFGDTDNMSYIDYKHFNITGPWISFKSWANSYALLPFYTYATNKEWLQAFVNYNTDYLLLKRLPFLQGKMFTETLMVRYLYTPDKPHYTELGYAVSLPMGLGNAGVFVAFDKFDYNSIGVQFAIPFIQAISNSRSVSIGMSF